MTTRAALYIRVSSEEQLDAIDGQLRAVRESAARRGYEIVRTFTDPGISAHSNSVADRADFQACIEAAKAGEIDVILVSEVDRWARNLKVFVDTLETLTSLHIPLVSLAFEVDYTSATGKYTAHIFGATAQFYSDQLSERTARGKAERARKGLHNNQPPLGYTRDATGAAVFDGTTVGVARAMWQLAAEGKTDRQVAEALANMGYHVSRDTIRYLVTNRFFVGEVRHRGNWYPGKHEPLIDSATFNTVQMYRRTNRRSASRPDSQPRGTVHAYTFGGLLTCGVCGHHITGHNAGTGYLCWGRRGYGCRQPGIDDRTLSDNFAAILSHLILDDRVLVNLVAQIPPPPPAADKSAIERRLLRLRQIYEIGDMEIEEYTAKRQALKDQLAAEPPPTVTSDDVRAHVVQLRDMVMIWREATPAERQKIAAAIVADMIVVQRRIVALKPQAPWSTLLGLVFPADVERGGYLSVTGA